MSDDYAFWQAKLAGLDPDPPADRTIMHCGFWRLRSGEPLAVWVADGERVALRGFAGRDEFLRQSTMESMAENGALKEAVTDDFYRAAIDKGYWPDSEGPTRDLMNAMRDAAVAFTATADQLADKLALYPDYRITKKLAGEIVKAVAKAGGALNTYTEKTRETNDVERRDAAA